MKAILNKKKIIKGTNIKVPLICGSSNNYLQGKLIDGEFHLLKSNGTFSEISMIPIEGKIYEDVTTGKLYKWNGSEYEETNSANIDESNMTEVKYSELVELRNSSKLVPGKFYRITDYENNSLVNFDGLTKKKFDIILLALTENKLAEEGWAAIHENIYDVTFTNGVTSKCYLYVNGNKTNIVFVSNLTGGTVNNNEIEIDEENKTAVAQIESDSEYMLETNLQYNDFQNSDLSNWKLWYCLDNDKFDLSETSTDKGIIYRIEDSTGKICKLKWKELKTLRDSAALVAGAKYRIIDYVTTTVQENTRSAGHQFDIIVTALTEGKLSEEASATMHENIYDVTFADGVTKKCYIYQPNDEEVHVIDCETLLGVTEQPSDVIINGNIATVDDLSNQLVEDDIPYNYFQNSNLSAWKVWYCLDNDTDRFAWIANEAYLDDVESNNSNGKPLFRQRSFDNHYNNSSTISEYKYAWGTEDDVEDTDPAGFLYSKTEIVSPGDDLYFGADDVKLVSNHGSITATGVIYRLIDEYNNDVAYDFKNIQFKRYELLTSNIVYDIDNVSQDDVDFYTDLLNGTHSIPFKYGFAQNPFPSEDSEVEEPSSPFISGAYYISLDDAGDEAWDNERKVLVKIDESKYIFAYTFTDKYELDKDLSLSYIVNNNKINEFNNNNDGGKLTLSNNVIFGLSKCNIICSNSFNNTLGYGCTNNILKYSTFSNTIGEYGRNIELGNYCYGNIISYDCTGNTLFDGCFCNIIKGGVTYSSIGKSSHFTQITGSFNKIGDECAYVIIKGSYNFVGSNCSWINIDGGGSQYNIIKSNSSYIKLSYSSRSVIIGRYCNNISIDKSYVSNIQFEDFINYVKLTTDETTSLNDRLQNIKVCTGVKGTALVKKTITHSTIHDTDLTIYQSNDATTVNV